MKILHLSDLHLHIEDPIGELWIKLEKMLFFLKEVDKIDYVIISGDHIFFSNPKENFKIFIKFMERLKEQINIDDGHFILCSGNHEWAQLKGEPSILCKNNNASDTGRYYIEAYERLCGKCWSPQMQCEVYEEEDFVLVVADAYYCIMDDDQGTFVRNCRKVNTELKKYFKDDGRLHILVQHAPEVFYCHNCEDKVELPKDTIVMCGHKIFDHKQRVLQRGECGTVYSGVSDGFVEENPVYGLYETGKIGLLIKYLEYRNGVWNWVYKDRGSE